MSENNIYITEEYYGKSETENIQTSIRKIAYDKGTLDAVGQTKIDGVLNDSFSIDEYNGYLRIAATVIPSDYNNRIMPVPYVEEGGSDVIVEDEVAVDNASIETNALYVLDENLEMTGSIQNLAKEETIHSARFMGDIGYFVTFKQIDPLFSVDLSDPSNPKIIGELKIPGFSDYLHPYGDGKLLGIGLSVDEEGMTTEGVKLSMFDISDPANVKEMSTYVLENVLSTDEDIIIRRYLPMQKRICLDLWRTEIRSNIKCLLTMKRKVLKKYFQKILLITEMSEDCISEKHFIL